MLATRMGGGECFTKVVDNQGCMFVRASWLGGPDSILESQQEP